MATTIGKEALAAVISALRSSSDDPEVVVEALWPDFKGAVAGALEEIKEREAEGLQRWREARQQARDGRMTGEPEDSWYYCYRRLFMGDPPSGVRVGRWYQDTPMPAAEDTIETAYLQIGDEEVRIQLRDLIIRERKPDYSYAYNMMAPGEPVFNDTPWVPVCPEGHQGYSTKTYPPTEHQCSECGRSYPIQAEDSDLLLIR